MYKDLGWVSLSRRRLIHRLTLFYKITNNMTPQYLADIVPPTVGDRQIYNLRSRDNITQIHAQNNVCGTLKCENAAICEKIAKCEKNSTLNVKIDAICEKITLNVKK